MIRGLILAAAVAAHASPAAAAVLDGVAMPDIRVVDGTRLRLNGIGLRTYSIFGIHIYVAGLYLEHRSDNPDRILHSPERKMLDIRFLRDVDGENAQKAWRDGFASNCRLPACYIDPRDIERFLASVPPIHKGDETTMVFTPKGVNVTINGQKIGDISDGHFAETLLATFIGPVPPTPELKRALLSGGD
jgi:hypothetical protein